MGVKISELAEQTSISGEDVIPIVDVETTGTRKIKISTLLSLVFPIGSTYVTQEETNPSTILGFGTWERLKGKVCLGLDENDADLNKIGNVGGEKNHTLTVAEIPSHNHANAVVNGQGSQQWGYQFQYTNTAGYNNGASANTGGGKEHNNMQPYMVVGYMWIRKS